MDRSGRIAARRRGSVVVLPLLAAVACDRIDASIQTVCLVVHAGSEEQGVGGLPALAIAERHPPQSGQRQPATVRIAQLAEKRTGAKVEGGNASIAKIPDQQRAGEASESRRRKRDAPWRIELATGGQPTQESSAGIEDVEHVEALGINVSRLFTVTFIIAGTLSGLAGGLHAPLIMVDPQMGIEVLAFVFMVVIIGGLGSIKGTLVSAFIVGQVVSIGSLIYAPLAQVAPFTIMLLILLMKPTGLYGSPLVKK